MGLWPPPPFVYDNVDEYRELLVVDLMGAGGEDVNGMYLLVELVTMGDIVVIGGKWYWWLRYDGSSMYIFFCELGY